MQTIKKDLQLLYAPETWVKNMADWKRLEAFELRVLRKLRSDDGNYLQEKPESDHHE